MTAAKPENTLAGGTNLGAAGQGILGFTPRRAGCFLCGTCGGNIHFCLLYFIFRLPGNKMDDRECCQTENEIYENEI